MHNDTMCKNAYLSSTMSIDRVSVIKFLDDMMAETGLAISALATASGISASTLNRYYSKRTDGIGLRSLNKVARHCGYDSYEDYQQIKTKRKAAELVKVRGETGAGEAVTVLDSEAILEEVEPPAGYYADGITAVVVRGDSMLPQLENNWLIFYKNTFAGIPAECTGKLCVVYTESEGMLVKTLMHGSKDGYYHLLSKNSAHPPIFDQKILWAARVIDIRPR